MGAASLGGTPQRRSQTLLPPRSARTFTILTGSSVTGTFTNTTIAINSNEHFNISYTATSVVLTVASGPVGGASAPVTTTMTAASNHHNASAAKPMASGARYMAGAAVKAKPIYVAGLNRVEARSNLIPADVLLLPHVAQVAPVQNWLAQRPAPVAGTAVESVMRQSLPSNMWTGRTARGTAMPGLISTTRRTPLPAHMSMPGMR